MSYQVLARKWRPRTLKDMVGQEHILRILENALKQNRIHHAYLFTGTRGVGKTTLARILAKCLNCESGITPTPCEICATCKAIDDGQFLDLYEVDAASRTKVEDTRELLDNVLYPPTQGRYKIYLIDEVHMLSNHSFNALLKTLEEPPEQVKFLLATTDPKRLPITILSRCLQFHLKCMSFTQIVNHLQFICTKENFNYEQKALEKLAKAAEGSMRDALSLLDQAICYGQGEITDKDVFAMLGSVAEDDLFPLLDALARKDGKELFNAISHLASRAPDFHYVLDEMINVLHKTAIAQIIPNAETNEFVTSLAKRIDAPDIQLYYQIALLGRRDLAITSYPQQGFEMTMLRMLAFKPAPQMRSAVAEPQLASHSEELKKKQPAAKKQFNHQEESSSTLAQKENVAANPTKSPGDPRASLPEWREILPKLELTGMAYALASNCSLEKMVANKIELALSATHEPMLNPKLKERISESLSRHFKQPIELAIFITADELNTPTKQHHIEQELKLAKATETIMQDPKVKQLIEMYDATVDVSLLK